jgi:cell wall-associated NlpC family hydrolase
MGSFALVNESVGELRRKPGHDAEQVSQVILGSMLRILGSGDGNRWFRVESEDGYRAWIRSWSVEAVTAGELETRRSGPTVEVDSMIARVRSEASGRSTPLREAPLGSRLRRLGRSGTWIRVLLPDGERGYLNRKDLLVDPGSLRSRTRPRHIPALLRTGMRFLGVPYQWGGVTPKGVDCSGLTQTVFRLHGVLLPRNSADQFRWVKRESYVYRDIDEIQYGHLLFFGESDARITHVGIGLADGGILHAQGRVRIASLRPQSPAFDRDLFRLFRGAGPVLLR